MSTNIPSRFAAASLLAVTLSLSACGAPDLGPRPQLRTPETFQSAQSLADSKEAAAWPQQQWWTSYNDPQLNGLVDRALKGSPDVASAVARIRQAQGAIQTVRGNLLPQINGAGDAEVSKQSYNNGTPASALPQGWKDYGTLDIAASFNPDIWGKNRDLLAAATSATEAAVADERQAELMLASNVVSGYFDLARLLARQDVLQDALKARQETAGLTGGRVKQGLDNESPLRQANSLVAQAQQELEANAEQIAVRRHALAALLGEGPDALADLTPPKIDAIPETPVPGDASIALAGRRPDIVAARRLVESADKGMSYSKKSFLPDISLSGLIGLTSLGIPHLFDSGSDYGNAGAAISLPIFQGGKLAGEYRMARAGYDTEVASYNSTVIKALQDVADSLASRRSAHAREQNAIVARDQADLAYKLAMMRYKGGLYTYLDVLSTQQTALSARISAVDAHYSTLASEVALTRALGGGYADDSSKKASDHE
ncbi:efflux transporter outer membrane subunit [Novosphingobium sp. 9]|uniref:efflux transporter outer membrane subunit n=1 Tax=Novosphingobium sp. 9 TaxID=2025349 RepID=UPI0021B5282C|nr:efflux transporter outer membrane subunit [Novosphingobium sp. 9]